MVENLALLTLLAFWEFKAMPGLFDNVGTHGGLLGLLTGRSDTSLAASLDPQRYQEEQQQKQQAATFQSLLPLLQGNTDLARAAALNPQILQQIAPELNQAPKLQEIGTDPLTGQKNFGIYRGGPNPSLTAQPIANGAGSGTLTTAQGMQAFREAAAKGVQGEDLYQYLPEGARQSVRSIVENRTNLSPFALGKPEMRPYVDAANIIDPSLSMLEPAARAKALADAKTGQVGQSQRGINQAIYHIADKLIPAMKDTKNTAIPAFNAVKNFINQAEGGTNTTAFYPSAIAVADEMSRAFKGSHMSDSQINAWKESLSPNMSPDQQKVAVKTLLGLLDGAAASAGEQRRQGIGDLAHAKMGPMIFPSVQKKLDTINDFIGSGQQQQPAAVQPQAAPAGTPQPGAVMKGYRFRGGNPADQNSWEKVQ